MDVTALLVFVGGFAICAALAFLVSFFGVKEQTFEEALAAQKKKNEKEKNKAKDKKKDGTKRKNQKWNKKKENEERSVEANVDELPEEEPVLVESLIEEAPVQIIEEPAIEPSPQPSPEVRETKQSKKNKNKSKLEIQDITEEVVEEVSETIVEEEQEPTTVEPVEEVVVEPEEVPEPSKPEVIEAAPAKPSPVVSKKVAKKQQSKAGNHGSKDLLSIVEKTVMNDFEAQQLIDVLLNKQSGSFTGGDNEWVEQGKMSETSKLQKQIGELEKAMEEEVAKGKSFKDKMTELRRELNEEKSAKAGTQRMIDELNNSRTQEINNLNNKLQQVQFDMTQQITIIQTQLNQQVQHNHQMELDQTHYMASIENLNQQLKKANEAAMNSTTSAANDQHILSELEQLRGLRNKYEVSLKEYATNNTSLQEQLTAKTEEALQLSAEASKVSVLQKQLEHTSALQNQANSEVTRLQSENSRLAAVEQEHGRVVAENERLSEQLTSSVERTEAEGQTDESPEENEGGVLGLKEKLLAQNDEHEKVKKDLEDKNAEHENVRKNLEEKFQKEKDEDAKTVDELKLKINELEKQITDQQSAMGSLKAKYDDLNDLAESNDDERIILLTRLFPGLNETDTIEQLEVAAKKQIEDLKQNALTNEKSESQVTHYKTVLGQTESMLTSLQNSVELEEVQWRSKLDTANNELTDVKKQVSTLQEQNSSLEERVSSAKQADEISVKLAESQSQLSTIIEEKNSLKKEVERVREELNTEKVDHNQAKMAQDELSSKNMQLSQLLAKGQQALEKETSVVKSMQEQLAKSRNNSGSDSIEELEIPTQTQMAAEEKNGNSGPFTLLLTIHKAELAKKGAFGKADPYVVVECGSQSFKTNVIDNDQTPEWNHQDSLMIDHAVTKSFRIEVRDEDIGRDDTLGNADVDIQDLIDAKEKWIDLENCKSGKVFISAQVKN